MTSAGIEKTKHHAQGELPSLFVQTLAAPAYRSIARLREDMLEFLEDNDISAACRNKLALSLSEILTNLVKHPPVKAESVRINLRIESEKITLDISDDSSPFADFDAKCKTALQKPPAALCDSEGGYGLACVLKQHANVWYIPAQLAPDKLNHFLVEDFPAAEEILQSQNAARRKIVFLVDDDPIALQIHQRMMGSKYDVRTFSDAVSALNSFDALQPALVVSDLNMPDMDGVALRKALSAREGGDSTPFVFLSGQKSGENNPYINNLGIDDFLCKPISQGKLLAVLDRLLSRSEQLRGSLQGEFHQKLSHALKPALPAMTQGWKITTMNSMVETGGGDFTLVHEKPQQTLAVLADVMGHGPMAKFFSYAYAGYLRSLFRLYSESPDAGSFMKHLSQAVSEDEFLDSIIMTCLAFQFYPDGCFRIASAGHPSPLRIAPNNSAVLNVAGPLPGLLGETSYTVKEKTFSPGEKILLMTDGFLHAFDNRGCHPEALLPFIQGKESLPHHELAEFLWSAYENKTAKNLSGKDDATLIIAEYGGA